MNIETIEDNNWIEPSMQEEDLMAETDIYSDSIVEKLEEDDEISVIEAAFMLGYNDSIKEIELYSDTA
jgi:hypothetical protein